MKTNAISCCAALCVYLYAGMVSALSTDRDQPINIEADWAEGDEIRRTTVYKGAVVITQGTMRISGDTVTMYYDENDDLSKLVAVGRPARFRQLPDGEKNYQQAKARRMEYYKNKDLVILIDKAESWKAKDRLRADRIEYDTLRGRVKAHAMARSGKGKGKAAAGGKTKSRVHITLTPKKKCEKSGSQKDSCPE